VKMGDVRTPNPEFARVSNGVRVTLPNSVEERALVHHFGSGVISEILSDYRTWHCAQVTISTDRCAHFFLFRGRHPFRSHVQGSVLAYICHVRPSRRRCALLSADWVYRRTLSFRRDLGLI